MKRIHDRTTAARWALQDAKADLAEVIRKARTEGPQRIAVDGRDEVIVISAEEYRRLKGERTGQALVDVLRDSPLGEVKMDRVRTRDPVRGVKL